jgi:hypothetical protein
MNISVTKRKYNETRLLEVRSLTPDDLHLLRQRTPPAFEVKTLRDRHHHIAWLIALGKSNNDIAAELRMSPARISQHKASPAFQELIAKYRKEIADARIEAGKELAAIATSNMVEGETLIQRRIRQATEDPESPIPIRDLNRIVADRMDRFGYPKHSTSDSRSVNINYAANLEAAIARSRKAG